MRAIKKINNNVAICLDGNGKEMIAFGIGIGFPQMPYEINDLSKISRTFYNISEQYLALINDIPIEIIEFTAMMVIFAVNHLPYTLNPNLVLTLADHISFAIEREKKHIYVRMPLAFDIEQIYPDEMQISKFILKKIKEELKVNLPIYEASGIAMAIVCARLTSKEKENLNTFQKQNEELLEDTTNIIEKEMRIEVNRNSFNYARYATHMQYLLQRIQGHKRVNTDNLLIYRSVKEEFTKVSDCVDKIDGYFQKEIHYFLSEEEKLYLILYVNRICAKEGL